MARAPGGTRTAFLSALALVVAVTAVLNLDTSVFFLTPVLVHLARVRGVDERPFLYGAVFMSNAASLYLPGSNLTNLIVLHGEHVSGALFFARTWHAATAAVFVTAAVLLALFRRELAGTPEPAAERSPARLGVGVAAVALVTVFVLVLPSPALPVLVTGIVAVVVDRAPSRRVLEAIGPRPSARAYTRYGLVLVPLSLGAALAAILL